MSKFMNARDNRTNIRWRLLATVSAFALLGSGMSKAQPANNDSDRPQIWIELGGQLSRLDDGQETFAPTLMAARPSVFSPSQKFEKPPLYSLDEYGKISFQPESSDWIFSASIRYGRSASSRHIHQQTHPQPLCTTIGGAVYCASPVGAHFADTNAQNSERHFILDFQTGKDVGLGMFGKDGSSAVSLGIRFAQFSSKSNIALKSDPDWHFAYKYLYGHKVSAGQPYQSNAASIRAMRSFRGIGPSISWNASAALMGSPQDSELTFDWGLNAAILFGRQRTKVHHQSTSLYKGIKYHSTSVSHFPPVDIQRTKSVTVPNIGGFAGLSFRYADAKLSLGYRADMFFGAMDGGIDTRKSESRGFFGPFASVSVGMGD